jgi:signal transduction histidine kinase
MNRRVFLQVTAPALVLGILLLGTCLVSVRYINRLQTNLANILSANVTSLEAAQELEIQVRRLRFHSFLYLLDPKPTRLKPIEEDHRLVEAALDQVRPWAKTPEELGCVQSIEDGYRQYRDEMTRLREQVSSGVARNNLGELADAHPVQYVMKPCQDLLRLNKEAMDETARESERVSRQAHLALLLLGLAGPVGGLVIGYGIARGLSRSIYRLSVRVQDMAQRLDTGETWVSIAADGDLANLDRQLQHVVRHVEEVAERLQRHQREMLRAEQLAAVGQLAASVAHEVRNPLTAVKLLVELALRPQPLSGGREPPEQCSLRGFTPPAQGLTMDDLRVIHREIARLEQTVQSFLDFARLPAPRRSRCDLRAVITQAVELVQARARQQQVEVAVRCAEGPVAGDVDRGQLGTVLVNLCLNALDAMPHGGRLEADVETVPGEGVRLRVADTGPGIPPELAGRLFTPFASTKPTGTGLGLSISRRIIEEHGGRLTADNRPEGGACFTIWLPPAPETGTSPVDGVQPAALAKS